MQLKWEVERPLVVSEEINLPDYSHSICLVNLFPCILAKYEASLHHRHFTQVGGFDASKYATTYPNIKFQLILARRVEGSIISTLVPSFLFLAIAYLAFFIPKDSMAVRLDMLLFMLLNT